jgi:hypothetical protein
MSASRDRATSIHCASRMHCAACRSLADNAKAFRAGLGKILGLSGDSFDCPHGIAWGATSAPIHAAKPPRPCAFMHDTGVKVEGRPCRCNWIICQCPDSPIKGLERVWWKSKCRAEHCRFYSAERS